MAGAPVNAGSSPANVGAAGIWVRPPRTDQHEVHTDTRTAFCEVCERFVLTREIDGVLLDKQTGATALACMSCWYRHTDNPRMQRCPFAPWVDCTLTEET